MSDSVTVTAIVVGFFVLLAILVFLRLLFRKGPPHWSQLRLGVYIERVPDYDLQDEEKDSYPPQPLPPSTYKKPE